MRFTPLKIALALALAVATGGAHAALNDAAMAPTGSDAKAVYWDGHEALKRADWDAALKRFRDLEDRLRRDEPAAADAAVYWQAYTLTRAGRDGEARSTIERLHRQYPKSRWGSEADTLLGDKAPNKSGDDADALAEVAIDGLLSAPPERAVPLLKKVLAGNYTPKVKKRALFVLSQTGDPSAIQSIEALALNGEGSLRREAIHMLGISGDPAAMQALERIYTGSKDTDTRRYLLNAFMVANERDTVLRIARTDADPVMRTEAVQMLGVMNATSELQAIFDADKDPDVRRAVLRAFGIAGDVPALSVIAGGNGDEALRVEAIHGIGIAGGADALVGLYAKADSPRIRDAVLQGLMVSGKSDAVLQLYRGAKDVEDKKRILRTLTLMGDDSAVDAIEEVLK